MTFDANRWGELWSPGLGAAKGEEVAALYTENCERRNVSLQDQIAGKAAIAEFADAFMGALPDAVVEIRSVTAQDDRVVIEWTWRGTHAGDLPGWPATGGTMVLVGVNVITLVDGLIHRELSYWDKETLFSA
jgi:steroid delta-isomerase-like uncharacterized protein